MKKSFKTVKVIHLCLKSKFIINFLKKNYPVNKIISLYIFVDKFLNN